MQRILSLNGNWGLTYADGPPIAAPWEFTTLNPAPARRLMTAEVPEPVHRTLEKHGLLDDPNFGMNSLRARWVEECYWILPPHLHGSGRGARTGCGRPSRFRAA
ncbi:MAG: hypothetical protein V8T86_10750 [Victivallis sp.]